MISLTSRYLGCTCCTYLKLYVKVRLDLTHTLLSPSPCRPLIVVCSSSDNDTLFTRALALLSSTYLYLPLVLFRLGVPLHFSPLPPTPNKHKINVGREARDSPHASALTMLKYSTSLHILMQYQYQ
jgi:hypothetical protein